MSLKRRRLAFTLVELLVVISILAFLATLTALYFPGFNDRGMTIRGVDQLSGWLLIARQQARRDGRPTGLRLSNDPIIDPTGKFFTTLTYIQQPEGFSPGTYTGIAAGGGPTGPAQFALGGLSFNADPNNFIQPVAAAVGDYVQINGQVHRITGVDVANSRLSFPSSPPTAPLPPTSGPYRLILQPRPIAGEQPLTLPINIGIDGVLSKPSQLPQNGPLDIVFAPSGNVIKQGSGSGLIIFWVRNTTQDNSSDLMIGNPRLVTVQPRTGFIAGQPVSSTAGNPYEFTTDGNSSGM